MIFFLNFDGTLTRQDTGRIYQGSTAVPEIKVLSGVSSASSVLEVAFTLPNGLVTQYFPLTQQGEYEQDGIKAFLWSLDLATGILANVTEQVGKVGVSVRQVNVINNTVVASYTATFDVEYSALPYTPTEYTPADTQELIDLLGAYYNQNQVLIDSIKGDYDSVIGRLDEQGEDITNIESDIDKLEELTDKPLLINITTDVETGVGTKYYNDGTTATFEIGTDVATSNRGNFMTEISFLATSLNWTQESDGTYSIVFSPATTERKDANCIVAVDKLDGTGYNQTANGVLKGSDGSLALYGVATPFDGKLLVLAGGGAGTKIWHGTDNLDGGGTAVGTPIAVGDTIDTLYFDTSVTPDLTELTANAEGYAQLITSGTHGDYGVYYYDMSLLSGGSINAYCLMAVPASSGMPAIIYSTASFDMDGVVATEGWNIDQLDWQDTVAEVSQQDLWSNYISKEPFTSGGGGSGTTGATPIVTGDTVETIYFDTSVTPDFSKLTFQGGECQFFYAGETYDSGTDVLVAYDMATSTEGAVNANCIMCVANNGETMKVVYSTAPFEFAGMTATEGWNTDQFSFGRAVTVWGTRDETIWSEYVSSTPFASEEGGEDKFADVLTGDYYLNTESGKLYVCTGRTDGEVDWEYLLTLKATLKINGVETQNASIFAPVTTREANTNNSCFVLVPNGESAPTWEQLTVETADNLTYTIKIGGKVAGSFELTNEIYLDSVTYNADTNKLTFTYNTASGKTSFDVDLSDLAGGNVALPSTGTTTISSSSFSITPTGWIATAYVANYTAGTSILISPNTISDYNTCQKIGVYYATKAIGDANTIQFYAKNQPNTGLNETITFAYTLIPANSATQAGAVVFDGATGVAKTTNITVTSTAWVQDDNGDYYWGNYCERTDLNIFKPANVYSQDTLISCGASGMYELPNTAGSTSSKMVIKVKTPPTTDIFIDKVTFNIGHPNTAMPCAILILPSASGGSGGGTSAKTGQVTVEASDWVAGDAFGAYRAIITLPTQMDYADTVLLSRTTVNDPHITFAGKWGTDTPTVRISALKAERVTFTWTVIPASATGATQGAVIVSAISQDEIVKVDWATLKDMRDNGKLAQGKQYRITDYVATTSQENTQSAGHPFDIIVVADSPNTLNENARAVAHEGDTYFANCNLNAWEIKYSLDNDKTRFAWAFVGGWWIDTDFVGRVYILDEKVTVDGQEFYKTTEKSVLSIVAKPKTNQEAYYYDGETAVTFEEDGDNVEGWGEDEAGKGVIYYLKDEHGNECPYDFKNIQFKRWQTETEFDNDDKFYSNWDDTGNDFRWCYTFMANGTTNDTWVDASTIKPYRYMNDEGKQACLLNTIKPYFQFYDGNEVTNDKDGVQWLNNIVLYGSYEDAPAYEYGYSYNYIQLPYSNAFGINCRKMTLGRQYSCDYNTFGNSCNSITFGDGCDSNSFGDSCSYNTFGDYCRSNTFRSSCDSNSFGNNCYNNIFGDGCRGNSFGVACLSNIFGNQCGGNTFGDDCDSNSFGNQCESNSFGNKCDYNTFGNYCRSNIFGGNCLYNTVDNGVRGAHPYPAISNNIMQGVHIHYGVTGQFNITRAANYAQDVRTANDVTIEV